MGHLKVKGVGIDEVFSTTAAKHGDHPDVKGLPVEELVEHLRKTKWQLVDTKKGLHAWLPPMNPFPTINLVSDITQRLESLIKRAHDHMVCIGKLDSPNKASIAQKRHWRAERDKLHNGLHEDHKIDGCMAKTCADVVYDDVAAASEVGITLPNPALVFDGQRPSWTEPFFILRKRDFEDETTEMHTKCWDYMEAALQAKAVHDMEGTIANAMQLGKIPTGRQCVDLPAF